MDSASPALNGPAWALPTERVLRLKERVLRPSDDTLVDRAFAYDRAFAETRGANRVWRKARALAEFIRTHRIEINEDELIVGRRFPDDRHGSNANSWLGFPENWNLATEEAREHFRQRIADHPHLSDDERERLAEIADRWRDTFGREARNVPTPDFARHPHVFFGWGYSLNHSVRDYAKVVAVGFEGIRREVEAALERLDWRRPEDIRRRLFLQSAFAVADAACQMGRRYADTARALAATCEDESRRAELLAVAEVCEQVPARPARTFREACQALWFAHMLTFWEDGLNANSIGRMDQMLWPAYQRDAAENGLTRQQAIELLHALHLKLYQTYDVQQATVGGQRPDGSDATNDLSFLVLHAIRSLGLIRCQSVRVCKTTPPELLRLAADLVADGGGIPFFFNDDAIVPALVDKGIPIEEARDYAAIGCVEITIPGRAFPHAVSHMMNLAKCLELALHDGFDPHTDQQLGPHTGDARAFTSFGQLWDAYAGQLEYWAERAAYWSNCGEMAQEDLDPLPYRSILTADCIERGLDIAWGGARYNYHSTCAIGIPNVADGLAGARKLVFEENALAMGDLLDALRANFEGREDLRQQLLHRAPKYGNDQPEVDDLAAAVARHYCETMHRLRTVRGGRFHAHLFSFVWHVNPCGKGTGALPDGRRAGEPLAYSLSPMQGRDFQGLSAVLNSLARIPHHLAAASSSAIIELDPVLLEGEGRDRFVQALRTALDRGVGQLQFNVVSAETLEQARDHPERYSNLAVRVSGYSYRFCLLDPEMQEHIIQRTKHGA
jgi:formate C-acetyltransferase